MRAANVILFATAFVAAGLSPPAQAAPVTLCHAVDPCVSFHGDGHQVVTRREDGASVPAEWDLGIRVPKTGDVYHLTLRASEFTAEACAKEERKNCVGSMPDASAEVDCPKVDCPKADFPTISALSCESDKEPLRVVGSNTIGAKLMPAILKEKARSRGGSAENVCDFRDNVCVLLRDSADRARCAKVSAPGSDYAFDALKRREADIGMASRRITPHEVQELEEARLPDMALTPQEHVLAMDGLVILINPRNTSIRSLDLCDVADLFSDRIADWAALGSTAGAVSIHARDDRSGTYDTFKSLVLRACGRDLSASARRYNSNEALVQAVASSNQGSLGAIGFAPISFAQQARAVAIQGRRTPNVHGCALAIAADTFTIKSEDYPLARRLYLYFPPDPKGLAREVLDFVRTEDLTSVIAGAGFLPLTFAEVQQVTRDPRFTILPRIPSERADAQQLLASLQGLRRLSVTFRFEVDGDTLDTKAWQDVERTVTWIRSTQPRRVVFVGYADSDGDYGHNLRLSERRANTVVEAVRRYGFNAQQFGVLAASESFPVGCESTSTGKARNRRVELWYQ